MLSSGNYRQVSDIVLTILDKLYVPVAYEFISIRVLVIERLLTSLVECLISCFCTFQEYPAVLYRFFFLTSPTVHGLAGTLKIAKSEPPAPSPDTSLKEIVAVDDALVEN